MPELGSILTAIVTPFDEQRRVDEDAFVAPAPPPRRPRLRRGRGLPAPPARRRRSTDEEHLRVIELAVQEIGDRATVVAGTGSNDTRHAVHLTERATELGADATAVGHAVLQQAQPARDRARTSRRSRAPPTARCCSTTSPSARASTCPTTCWPSSRRSSNIDGGQAGQRRPTSRRSTAWTLYAGNDDMLADVLDMGGAGGILVAQPRGRRRDAPDGRRARAPARDRRGPAATSTTRVGHHEPDPRQGGAEHARASRSAGLRLPLVEADDEERAVDPRRCSSATGCSPPTTA